MNSIPERQNAPLALRWLGAQRRLYAVAKILLGLQLILSGPLSVFVALVVMRWPDAKALATFWGLLVVAADLAWLTPWQRRLRDMAARTQELFDCDVLELPWNPIKTGTRPDPETAIEYAAKYQRDAPHMPTLLNWYPPAVGCVPLHSARVICQRSNCRWDAKQRRMYAGIVLGVVIVVVVFVFVVGLSREATLPNFLLGLLAPLIPMLVLGYRICLEQLEAAKRLDSIKQHIELLWHDLLEGTSESEVAARSRVLQDEIYESRRKSPPVFDAIFKFMRPSLEVQMTLSADELVAEVRQKLGSP